MPILTVRNLPHEVHRALRLGAAHEPMRFEEGRAP